MAGKQQERIGELFHQAHYDGVDLKKGRFDPFDIEYGVGEGHDLKRLALVGTSRAIIPSIGNISWSVFKEGGQEAGLERESCEDIRRQTNVGILIGNREFRLLELPDPDDYTIREANTLIVTSFVVAETFDPTVGKGQPYFV